MENNAIKSLAPRKNSKYHQGYVDRKTCKKLFDSVKGEPIIYRSGLELDFINFCEFSPSVNKWSSEPIKIPYFNRIKNNNANYYPDYVLETKGKDGSIEHLIVEIKPYEQTKKPKPESSRWLKEAWITNTDKWAAAKKFAEEHNAKFVVVTEKFFE